ncbi:MAG: transporter substrate-binding protein [Phycisphaerales bacterium]
MRSTASRILIRLAIAVAIASVFATWMWVRRERRQTPYRLGVVAALTGKAADRDAPTANAVAAAVDVLNAGGGISGHPVEMVIRDSRGDEATAASEARRLVEGGVGILIAGAGAGSRRAIEGAIAPLGGLVLSPHAGEGLDDSPSLITFGTLPNQRAVPAAAWAVRACGPKLYLVANEGLTQRTVSAILHDHVPCIGGTIVGESWCSGEPADLARVAAEIRDARPNAIISGLDRTSSLALAAELVSIGVTPASVPTVAWQLRAADLERADAKLVDGNYLVASSFFAEDEDLGPELATAYAVRSSGARPDARAIAAAAAVRMLADAMSRCGGVDATSVRAALLGAMIPRGGKPFVIDSATQCAWLPSRVGKIGRAGDGSMRVETTWSSDGPIRPQPWPVWRSRTEWDEFVRRGGKPVPAMAAESAK